MLGNVNVAVAVPASNEQPHTMAGRDFLLLFQALDVGNVIMLWALLLSEQKVALQGRQPHVLTMAAETLSALLFPFSWQHVYIPILPERLLDVLQAPVPFLIGIDASVLALAEQRNLIPDDVVQVDLDANAILCEPDLANMMHLPQKQYHKLYKAIAPYCRPPNAEADDDDEQPASGGSRGRRESNAASAFPMAPPPDVDVEDGARVTLSEMSEESVAEAIKNIKAAFLRFFVSLMLKYTDFIVVPISDIRMPAAVDFWDRKRWMARFQGNCAEWLEMFTDSQSFTQFLEQRLAPRDTPELEVCFFNESIDAKMMRSAKTKFFAKHHTPLLSSGVMPPGGYGGMLVPAAARTVYNASMIAARPVKQQQQLGLLLVLGSGLQEHDANLVADFAAAVKKEFARNILWSRVDVDAALLIHVCMWTSVGAAAHAKLREQHSATGGPPLENLAVRDCMLDLMAYADGTYRRACHDALRQSLRELARDGGGTLPLCVVAHGFGSVVAIESLSELQAHHADDAAATGGGGGDGGGGGGGGGGAAGDAPATPIERGETLAFMCTLGSPLPLLATGAAGGDGDGGAMTQLQIPAPAMLTRCPHLRGGWTNVRHKHDELGHALRPLQKAVTREVECRTRRAKGTEALPWQSSYFTDLVECVGPLTQGLSMVWQDTNRKTL